MHSQVLKFQNAIATIIATLQLMRDNPRKNTNEHLKNLLLIESSLPDIKRALMYFENTKLTTDGQN